MPSFIIPETLFVSRNRLKQIRLKVPVLFAMGNMCHPAFTGLIEGDAIKR